MTALQKVIKYLAVAFAVFLIVAIISGAISAIGLFGGFFDNDAVEDNLKTYEISANISGLEIEVGAADLVIKQGEGFSVESNLKRLSVEEKNGVLTVKEKNRFGNVYNGAVLTVVIPADTVFDRARIVTGAGRLTADDLSAYFLSLVLGAGEVNINSLNAFTEADIDGGAGKLTIANGTLNNLELEMGVGQLNLTASILGESDLDLGVGETNLTLIGDKNDYGIDLEKGIGNIKVDGKAVSDFDTSGKNEVDISCGIGSLNMEFKAE